VLRRILTSRPYGADSAERTHDPLAPECHFPNHPVSPHCVVRNKAVGSRSLSRVDSQPVPLVSCSFHFFNLDSGFGEGMGSLGKESWDALTSNLSHSTTMRSTGDIPS